MIHTGFDSCHSTTTTTDPKFRRKIENIRKFKIICHKGFISGLKIGIE
jgi:hypothetical protein